MFAVQFSGAYEIQSTSDELKSVINIAHSFHSSYIQNCLAKTPASLLYFQILAQFPPISSIFIKNKIQLLPLSA